MSHKLVIAAALILLNGVFALSELAVVSARKPRLKPWLIRAALAPKPPWL